MVTLENQIHREAIRSIKSKSSMNTTIINQSERSLCGLMEEKSSRCRCRKMQNHCSLFSETDVYLFLWDSVSLSGVVGACVVLCWMWILMPQESTLAYTICLCIFPSIICVMPIDCNAIEVNRLVYFVFLFKFCCVIVIVVIHIINLQFEER